MDAQSQTTSYEWDNQGNLSSIIHADFSQELFGVDATGVLTSWTNARNQTTSYGYNAQGLTTTASSSHFEYLYERNSLGGITGHSDGLVPDSATTLTWNNDNELSQIETADGRSLGFIYDNWGRKLSQTDELGVIVSYSYDDLGRMVSVSESNGGLSATYAYDDAGRLSTVTRGNGVVTAITYDSRGLVASVVNSDETGTTLSYFDYAYDARKLITTMETHYGTWSYTHDLMGRLLSASLVAVDSVIGDQVITYAYDAVGNRTEKIHNGTVNNYAFNVMNQCLSVGGLTLLHDADGNLTSVQEGDTSKSFSYDSGNRLINASELGGFRYDGLTQRTQGWLVSEEWFTVMNRRATEMSPASII